MKRTFVLVLTAFLALTWPACACTTMTGFEPINSAKLWKSWNSSDRYLYLYGFMDGSSHEALRLLAPTDEKMQTTALQ
jgi:hypothetical protein